MNPTSGKKCVVIIAGEAPGDIHGAGVVEAMSRQNPDLFFCGIGGPALAAAGVKILVDSAELSVVGITEVFHRINSIYRGAVTIKRLLKSLKPDLLILVDYPEFNLHIAAVAKKYAIPVLYYVSPQIWAWRQGRIKKIGERIDHMAVILPFEKQFYDDHHIPASFVGHPLLDTVSSNRDWLPGDDPQKPPIIGLVPGSRKMEIRRLLPSMLLAARMLETGNQQYRFIISIAPTVTEKQIAEIVDKYGGPVPFELVTDIQKVLQRSGVIMAASGTVTLEAALAGIPMVVIYKVSPLSYWLGRLLIKVDHISLVNLIAGKEIIPELIQGAATPENIALKTEEILNNQRRYHHLRTELRNLREILGRSGAAERVAVIALGMLGSEAATSIRPQNTAPTSSDSICTGAAVKTPGELENEKR